MSDNEKYTSELVNKKFTGAHYSKSKLIGYPCDDNKLVRTTIVTIDDREQNGLMSQTVLWYANQEKMRRQKTTRNAANNFLRIEEKYTSSVYIIRHEHLFKNDKKGEQKTGLVFHALANGVTEYARCYGGDPEANRKRTQELQREMDFLRTMDNFKEGFKWLFGCRRPSVQQSHDRVREMSRRYAPAELQ